MSAEEVTKQLEAIRAEQEKEEKAINARIASLRDQQFRQTQLVQQLKTEELALQADIQSAFLADVLFAHRLSTIT
jgi:hypothetical protein